MVWGHSDCQILPARALDALTGDPVHGEPHRGKYDKQSALRYQLRVWRSRYPNYLSQRGAHRIEGRVVFGDIVLFRQRDWPTPGGAMFVTNDLMLVPLASCIELRPIEHFEVHSVWRVPH